MSEPKPPRELKVGVGVSILSSTAAILFGWAEQQKAQGNPRASRSSVMLEMVDVLEEAGWAPGKPVFLKEKPVEATKPLPAKPPSSKPRR